MKLIVCRKCDDVIRLEYGIRVCACKKSGGRYLPDGLHAEVWGPCLPLGFNNSSFTHALRNQPDGGRWGMRFEAFVIEKNCPTVRVRKTKPRT